MLKTNIMNLFATKETPNRLQENISRISRDDYNNLLIVSNIRKAIRCNRENGKIADFIRKEYDYHLKPHFTEEETLLFSRLPHNDPLRIQAQRQHDHLKYLVWVCSNEVVVLHHFPKILLTALKNIYVLKNEPFFHTSKRLCR